LLVKNWLHKVYGHTTPKKILAKQGVTQTELASLLGRDKSVITNLFQGRRQLKAKEAAVIATRLGVSVAQVMGIKEAESAAGGSERAVLIPFQNEPVASKVMPTVIERSGRYYYETEHSGLSEKAYAFEMRDDSMNLAGILAGDVLISEVDRPYKNGQIVIAQYSHKGGTHTVVRKYEPPFLISHSTSAEFKPLRLEQDELCVISPVLKLIRAF
jgi:SOS-response transcriptional repressor LexA